jgi:putative peptidoglycan lipid II flippase
MTEAALTRQRMGFWGAAVTLSFAILVNRATTFLTQTVIAHRFGTSAFTDAYFAVEYVLLVVGEFVVIGFSAAFIPLWMEYKVRRGEHEAQKFANAAISLLTVTTIVLALVISWAAPVFVRVVAPGFSDEAASMAGQLLTVTAFAVVFLGLTAGCTAMLEANGRFIQPELSRVAYSVVILVAAIAFGGRFGLMALAWGTVIGSLVRLLVQLPNALKLGAIQLTWRFDHEGVRRLGRVLLPIFVAYAGMRVTLLLANFVASGLPEGAISGLGYAVRVMLLPVGLLALPLRTTIFPTLSHNVAENQLELMGETALRGMRVIIFTTVPVCVGLIVFRVPLIQLLFQRGAFDSAATQMTADILGWLALGLPAISGLMIVNSIFFSLGNPTALVKINVVNWVAMLVASLALVRWFGANGVALAVALSTTIAFFLAILTLKRRLPNLALRPLGQTMAKATVAAGLMVALLLALNVFLNGAFDPGESTSALLALFALSLGTLIGASAYALATWLLRMQEAHALVRVVSEWLALRIAAK